MLEARAAIDIFGYVPFIIKWTGLLVLAGILSVSSIMSLAATSWGLLMLIMGEIPEAPAKTKGDDDGEEVITAEPEPESEPETTKTKVLKSKLEVRITGFILLLVAIIVGPSTGSALELIFPSAKGAQQFSAAAFASFRELWLVYLKAWVVVIFDVLFVTGGWHATQAVSAAILEFVNRSTFRIDSSGSWKLGGLVSRHRGLLTISIMNVLFQWLSGIFLALTGMNILVYGYRYGFWSETGSMDDFGRCYMYSFVIFFLIAAFIPACMIIVGGLTASVFGILSLPYLVYTYHIKQEKGEFVPIYVAAGCYIIWCVLLPTWDYFNYNDNCYKLIWGLGEATDKLYLPGAENQTLSWGAVYNTTGVYNVTLEPYRPSPRTNKIGSPMEEFGCSIVGAYQYVPYLPYAIGVSLVCGLGWYLSILWAKRKAKREGKAYELMAWGR